MKESTKTFSDRQEKAVANYLGWKQVTGSGARPGVPGDIVSDEWLGECKTHTTPGHKILFNLSVWDKILDEATSKFKYPLLVVDDGSQKIASTFCMYLSPGNARITQAVNNSWPVVPLPENWMKTNINFKIEDFGPNHWTIYIVKINKIICAISRLETFRELMLQGEV